MNILIVTQFPVPHGGGASSHISDLTERLNLENHKVRLIEGGTLAITRSDKLRSIILSFGSRDRYRRILVDRAISNNARKIQDVLKNIAFDLIHCHDPMAGYAVKMALLRTNLKIPVVETIHGPLAYEAKMMCNREIEQSNYLRRLWEIELAAFKNANRLAAVDTGQARIAIEDFGIEKEKITVIFNAVSFEGVNVTARQPGKINAPQPYLLVPRRLVRKTGVHIAIEALAKIDERINLVIAGDGVLRADLEGMTRQLGLANRVFFLGSIDRDEVLKLAGKSVAVLVPSIPSCGVVEATSIAALEAMACGTVIVASRIGGLAEIIKDGSTGLLVPHSDASALAGAVNKLYGNPSWREEIAKQGQQYLKDNLDTSIWYKKIMRFYYDAISHKRMNENIQDLVRDDSVRNL